MSRPFGSYIWDDPRFRRSRKQPWNPNKPKVETIPSVPGKIVRRVAALLETGRPTVWRHEGTARAGIRSALAEKGYAFEQAESINERVVKQAYIDIAAPPRPSWAQGQPAVDPRFFTDFRYCQVCKGEIEDDEYRYFCSRDCASISAGRAWQARRAEDHRSHRLAFHAVLANGSWPRRTCAREACEREFELDIRYPHQKFCSKKCFREHDSETRKHKPRPCGVCGKTIENPTRDNAQFCCRECADEAKKKLSVIPCGVCGKPFQPRNQKRRFCSRKCSGEHHSEFMLARSAGKRDHPFR